MNLKNNFLSKYPLAAVFAFAFICLLPAMLLRDFTPSNELRYLSIADEAIAGGHFFAFFNHGVPYADKPPLYLWIVMLCREIFGHHSVFVLSLFSFVPAMVTVWIMDRWVMTRSWLSDRMAVAMMLLTCVMFLGTAVVIRMDMLMCMFIVLALYTFWKLYSGESSSPVRDSWLLPVWIFLALFTKGPVGLLVPPLSVLVFLIFRRRWKDIGKYLGWKTWGVIAGLCALWFTCVYIDGGRSYLDNLLFKQTMGRAVNAFTHSKPFWFYAVALLWCVAPYMFLLVGSLAASFWPWGKSGKSSTAYGVRSDKETLFVCVILTTFVMLSSFSSKLPVYLVPVFPFIVYLFPLVLNRIGGRKWMIWAIAVPAAVLALAGILALLAMSGVVKVSGLETLRSTYPFAFSAPVRIAALLLIIGNVMSLWFLYRRRVWNLPVFMIGASLLLTVYSASGVLGKANAYLGYGAISKEIPAGTEVITLFVSRPENIDVYIGRQIKDYGNDVEAFLQEAGDRDKDRPMTLVVPESRLEENPELSSFVYSSGTVAYVGPYCVMTKL